MASDSSSINKKSYQKDSVVRYWSTYSKDLFYGEGRILERLLDSLKSASFLDVGVGGGRTTGSLMPLVREYVGLDYSQKLVDQCRLAFPTARFVCANACELAKEMMGNKFDFIYFSFNGIDCLNEPQRQVFLQQAHETLNDGGRLMFSSHNYYAAKIVGRQRRLLGLLQQSFKLLFSGHPKSAVRTILFMVNYLQNSSQEYASDDIVFLVDSAQGNREIYAWIKPERQVDELRSAGYRVLAVYDWNGEQYEDRQLHQIGTHSAYYLAEKLPVTA